jgi:hypothetical protein
MLVRKGLRSGVVSLAKQQMFEYPVTRKNGDQEQVKVVIREDEPPVLFYNGNEFKFERVARAIRNSKKRNATRLEKYYDSKAVE